MRVVDSCVGTGRREVRVEREGKKHGAGKEEEVEGGRGRGDEGSREREGGGEGRQVREIEI